MTPVHPLKNAHLVPHTQPHPSLVSTPPSVHGRLLTGIMIRKPKVGLQLLLIEFLNWSPHCTRLNSKSFSWYPSHDLNSSSLVSVLLVDPRRKGWGRFCNNDETQSVPSIGLLRHPSVKTERNKFFYWILGRTRRPSACHLKTKCGKITYVGTCSRYRNLELKDNYPCP